MLLHLYGFWYGASQLHEKYIVPWRYPRVAEKEPHAPTEVALMHPPVRDMYTPQKNVVVFSVSGVPDRDTLE